MRLITLLFLCLPLVAQASMYKCLDKAGKVTYTNGSCNKIGLKEAKLIPPPPPPAIDRPVARPASTKQAASPAVRPPSNVVATVEATLSEPSMAKLAMNKPIIAGSGNCASISDQIGQIMDEIDAERQAGQASKPSSEQSRQLSRLQAEKSRLACF